MGSQNRSNQTKETYSYTMLFLHCRYHENHKRLHKNERQNMNNEDKRMINANLLGGTREEERACGSDLNRK